MSMSMGERTELNEVKERLETILARDTSSEQEQIAELLERITKLEGELRALKARMGKREYA